MTFVILRKQMLEQRNEHLRFIPPKTLLEDIIAAAQRDRPHLPQLIAESVQARCEFKC